ncbi:MAG: DUF6657 family protein [Spirochaetia bacterium]
MSEIKSALELALERTADVKSDKSLIEAHETKQLGMKLAGKLLDDPGTNIKAEFNSLDEKKRTWAREGFVSVLISHLSLPTQEADLQRLRKVTKGLETVARDPSGVVTVMEQVEQLLQQYLDNKTQLVESLRQQFEPRLRQQEQEIAQQTGNRVKLDPASDPEFAKALSQNMQRLQSQYGQVVEQARDQLKNYL